MSPVCTSPKIAVIRQCRVVCEVGEQGLVEDAIPDLPVDTQGIYAVYPPGRFTQPKVRAFIDFLVHQFADKGPKDW